MILLIRGHIRTGFDTPYLYNFVKAVYALYKVKINIQTWSVFSNSISWRPIANNPTKVTEEVIKNYFKDIPINDILILDDTKISLNGIKSGNVGISCVPMIGWKNMWYGKSVLADYVAAHESPDSLLINTRFDCVFEYANIEDLLLFIKKSSEKIPQNLVFRDNKATGGVDNFYMTTVALNQRTSQHFNKNLDNILMLPNYKSIAHPEFLVFFENKRLYN